MRLNHDAVKRLIENKGWSEVMFAQKLGVDYSYVYRVLRKERGIGKKFITGLMKLCEKEKMNFRKYVILK
ncbi:MAG: helix-turn-helix transcriptional regulator [Halanaerobiales bacterium]|nr:helix-turn-helix transcriptional regulator [Halanaerobiales bacterium]